VDRNLDYTLLYRVAKAYFKDEKTQQEIADVENFSRSQISRLLKRVLDENLVTYTLNFPAQVDEDAMAEQLREMSGLSPAVTAPAVKIAGIGVLGQCTVGVCEDAGEKALAKTAEILTSACCVYLSLPLLQAVMDLLEHLLGG